MYIRIKKDGEYSGWFQNTKKIHRALLADPPETVQIYLDDIYQRIPDSDLMTEISFRAFNVITREAVLEENRYLKRLERYHDGRSLDEIERVGGAPTAENVEEEYIRRDQLKQIHAAEAMLTADQWRRIKLQVIDGLSYRKIAALEGVKWQTVQDSVELAWKKLKKIFN